MLFSSEVLSLINHASNSIPLHMKEKLTSKAFIDACRAIDSDEKERIRLTIALLKIIALDPKSKYEEKDSAGMYGGVTNLTQYSLRFHRVINPIGWLSVVNYEDTFTEIELAIKENLNSRMYKAAQVSRRIDSIVNKGIERISKKGRELSLELKDEMKSKHQTGLSDRNFRLTDEQYAEISNQVLAFENPKKENLYARFRSVERLTSPGIEKGYYAWFATFLFHNIFVNANAPREELVLVG